MSDKEKLNMALDEVIKLSKTSTKRGGPRRGSKGPQRGGRSRLLTNRKPNRFFQGRGQRPSNMHPGQNNSRRRPFNRLNKPSFKKEGQQNFGKRVMKAFIKKTGKNKSIERKLSNDDGLTAANKKTILRISGLHLNIVNTELYDLFSQFGPMKKCRIDYDQLGRSYGTAVVQYEKHEHAEKAVADYNGAELDGHKLHVEYLDRNIIKDSPQVPQVRRRTNFKQRGTFNRRIRKNL